MTIRFQPTLVAAVLLAAVSAGCSSDGPGEVRKVSKEDLATQHHNLDEKTIAWLEKMPASDRQASVDRAPKVHEILKDASSTDLKSRVDALNVKF